MARSASEYLQLLKSLMPSGRFWTRDPDSGIAQLLSGMADELARVDLRGDDLVRESDSRTVEELITEMETDFGITDPGATLTARRGVIQSKLVQIGQQFESYYQEVASKLGYIITITEFTPFWAGLGRAGDSCGGQNNAHFFKVNVDLNKNMGAFSHDFYICFDAIFSNDRDYLYDLTRSLDAIIAEINRIKPAHKHALYDFHGAAFDRAFSWGFDSIPTYDGTCPPGSFGSAFGDGFANIREYDGTYLIGAFGQGFDLSFDSHRGGAFGDSFGSGFNSPA